MADTDRTYMLIDAGGKATANIPRHEDGTLLAMAIIEKLRPVAVALGARVHLHESRIGRDRIRVYTIKLHTTSVTMPDGPPRSSGPLWRAWLATVTPSDVMGILREQAAKRAVDARKEASEAVNAAQDAEQNLATLDAAVARLNGTTSPVSS